MDHIPPGTNITRQTRGDDLNLNKTDYKFANDSTTADSNLVLDNYASKQESWLMREGEEDHPVYHITLFCGKKTAIFYSLEIFYP